MNTFSAAFSGPINSNPKQASTIKYSLDTLFKGNVLKHDISSLLAVWDLYEDDTVDRIVRKKDGVELRPVRVCILKSLLKHKEVDELHFFMETSKHLAIEVVQEISLGYYGSIHFTTSSTSNEPVKCCEEQALTREVHACKYCDIILCDKNPDLFCPMQLSRILEEAYKRRAEEEAEVIVIDDDEESEEEDMEEEEDSDEEYEEDEEKRNEERWRRGGKYGPSFC